MDNATKYIDNSPHEVEETILVGQEIIEALPCSEQFRENYPKSLPFPVKAIIYFEPYWSGYFGSENDFDCGGGVSVEIHMENGAVYSMEKLDPFGEDEEIDHSGPWEEYMTPEVQEHEKFDGEIPYCVIDLAQELIPRHYLLEAAEDPSDNQ